MPDKAQLRFYPIHLGRRARLTAFVSSLAGQEAFPEHGRRLAFGLVLCTGKGYSKQAFLLIGFAIGLKFRT